MEWKAFETWNAMNAEYTAKVDTFMFINTCREKSTSRVMR